MFKKIKLDKPKENLITYGKKKYQPIKIHFPNSSNDDIFESLKLSKDKKDSSSLYNSKKKTPFFCKGYWRAQNESSDISSFNKSEDSNLLFKDISKKYDISFTPEHVAKSSKFKKTRVISKKKPKQKKLLSILESSSTTPKEFKTIHNSTPIHTGKTICELTFSPILRNTAEQQTNRISEIALQLGQMHLQNSVCKTSPSVKAGGDEPESETAEIKEDYVFIKPGKNWRRSLLQIKKTKGIISDAKLNFNPPKMMSMGIGIKKTVPCETSIVKDHHDVSEFRNILKVLNNEKRITIRRKTIYEEVEAKCAGNGCDLECSQGILERTTNFKKSVILEESSHSCDSVKIEEICNKSIVKTEQCDEDKSAVNSECLNSSNLIDKSVHFENLNTTNNSKICIINRPKSVMLNNNYKMSKSSNEHMNRSEIENNDVNQRSVCSNNSLHSDVLDTPSTRLSFSDRFNFSSRKRDTIKEIRTSKKLCKNMCDISKKNESEQILSRDMSSSVLFNSDDENEMGSPVIKSSSKLIESRLSAAEVINRPTSISKCSTVNSFSELNQTDRNIITVNTPERSLSSCHKEDFSAIASLSLQDNLVDNISPDNSQSLSNSGSDPNALLSQPESEADDTDHDKNNASFTCNSIFLRNITDRRRYKKSAGKFLKFTTENTKLRTSSPDLFGSDSEEDQITNDQTEASLKPGESFVNEDTDYTNAAGIESGDYKSDSRSHQTFVSDNAEETGLHSLSSVTGSDSDVDQTTNIQSEALLGHEESYVNEETNRDIIECETHVDHDYKINCTSHQSFDSGESEKAGHQKSFIAAVGNDSTTHDVSSTESVTNEDNYSSIESLRLSEDSVEHKSNSKTHQSAESDEIIEADHLSVSIASSLNFKGFPNESDCKMEQTSNVYANEGLAMVLERCYQQELIAFQDAFPDEELRNSVKVGEGVYGEVFLIDRASNVEPFVVKIIPVEGNIPVNGETQKSFEEILPELIISQELSMLRDAEDFFTDIFCKVENIWCVKGKYPDRLLELWKNYDSRVGSENDSPEVFDFDQLYIALELENGGQDLASFKFSSARQSFSIFLQTCFALAIAEECLEFEHRDLHWGNVLVKKTKKKSVSFILYGETYNIQTYGVKATVIDYTLSRIMVASNIYYNDLSLDPDLFKGTGDYQFEIYRLMQKLNCNEWLVYEPKTNVQWLDYMRDKLVLKVKYTSSSSKIHGKFINILKSLEVKLKGCSSAYNFVHLICVESDVMKSFFL